MAGGSAKKTQNQKEGWGGPPPADGAVPGEDKGGEDKKPRAFAFDRKMKGKDERDKD